jgi:glycerate dehydrogenase
VKIVVLDGYATNPGDLSWDGLAGLGQLTVYDRTPAELTVERAAGAEVLITNKVFLGAAEIAALPDLIFIGIQATGVNVVDLVAARQHEVAVTNVPAYSTASVAQHVFALLLELVRGVGLHNHRVRQGAWSNCPDFAFQETPQIELADKVFGVVGFGDIGRATAKIAAAFGMRVVVHTRTPDRQTIPDIDYVELDQLLTEADVISLSCPLTPDTEKLINAERLGLMKETAYLINTGRGLLVDEAALACALQNGEIAGAGLDVLSREPPPADNPLLGAPNCFITPHLAWATRAARQRLIDELVANLKDFLGGASRNRVD